jgi:hypothetical protein
LRLDSSLDSRIRILSLILHLLQPFADILLLFAIVHWVFADVPSLSTTVLADSFPSAQYFATTPGSAGIILISTSLDIFCDQRSLREPLPSDVSHYDVDLEALGL